MNDFIKRFQKIVKKFPNNIAIHVNNYASYTYRDLEQKSNALASFLLEKNITPNCLIVLMIEKSAEYIIALLAVWKIECAFIPLDPELPIERKNFILKETNPAGILYARRVAAKHVIASDSEAIQRLFILKPLVATLSLAKTGEQSILKDHGYISNLAYIIFTSGSSGFPKGAMISHAGIMPFIDAQIKTFNLNSNSKVLFYISIQFDASISDIGTTLLSGATLFIADEFITIALNKYQITHIDLPPSLLGMLKIEQMPKSLQTIIIGGEVCASHIIQEWSKHFNIINVYGPTEATVCTSLTQCTSCWSEANIGLPIKGIRYKIVNQNLKVAKEGELLIAGKALAIGYINNPQLTAEKFIILNKKRYYKTGDLVKKIHNSFIFLGRIDRQIKFHGKLIALEEIERVIKTHPKITNAAVIYDDTDGIKRLIAFVESKHITIRILKTFLGNNLHAWMLPNNFIFIKKLPKTITGKIDYIELQKFSNNKKLSLKTNQTNKTNKNAKILQKICRSILKLNNEPSIYDDLIDDVGCNSIDLLNIIVNAEEYKIYLSPHLIQELRTIYALSTSIDPDDLMFVDELKKQCVYTPNTKHLLQAHTEHILLTGATGFLGIHILYELCLQINKPIVCLVRAKNQVDGFNKLILCAQKYDINLQPWIHQIKIIIGDISLSNLGLTTLEWNNLCESISTIYHCAAEVNMFKCYQELKTINLVGTQEIIHFASTAIQKKIHYVSTLSVFVSTNQNKDVCYESDALLNTQYVYGGYAQTKWAAEYYLRQTKLNYTIYRLGLITGHSVNGKTSPHDFLAKFIIETQQLGISLKGQWEHIKFDATPVDYAAKALVYISNKGLASCYHIANTNAMSYAMILTEMAKLNCKLRAVNLNTWLKKIYNNTQYATLHMALCRILNSETQSHFMNYFERYKTMDLFQATGVIFDQTNTLNALQKSNIHLPKDNSLLLSFYIKNILKL